MPITLSESTAAGAWMWQEHRDAAWSRIVAGGWGHPRCPRASWLCSPSVPRAERSPDTQGIVLASHCHKRRRIQPRSGPCWAPHKHNMSQIGKNSPSSGDFSVLLWRELYIPFQMAATWQDERPFPVICQEKQRIAKSHNSNH